MENKASDTGTGKSGGLRSWFQFRLRTFLIVVAFSGVFLGWVGNHLLSLQRQWDALAIISTAADGEAARRSRLSYKTAPASLLGIQIPTQLNPQWKRIVELDVSGDKTCAAALENMSAFPYVTKLDLSSRGGGSVGDGFDNEGFGDDDMSDLGKLKQLRELRLSSPKLTGRFLSRVRLPESIEKVGLIVERFDNQGIQSLANLPRLSELRLWENTDNKSCGIIEWDFLRELERLQILQLVLNANDELGAPVGSVKGIQHLGIQSNCFSDEGMAHAAASQNAHSLTLFCPKVTEASLPAICDMKQLNEIVLGIGTRDSTAKSESVDRLKQTHPRAKINVF